MTSDFYGVPVPASARSLCKETLTYATNKSLPLVDAHLKSNFAYFGSLDKTLSGFFILDSTGDDYTLLDLREKNGEVFFLDHDELVLTARFDSLRAYSAWRAKKAALPRAFASKAKRKPTTAKLWGRYRWLVWLLAQPKQVDEEEAVTTAVSILERYKRDDLRAAFERELEILPTDPHLAIYWLLHFTCTGDDVSRARVVAALKKSKNALVRAFIADEVLAVLPTFRTRRSRFIYELARGRSEPQFAEYLKAFEIDSVDRGLDKAVALWADVKTDEERATVRAMVGTKKGPGAEYLKAELASFDGHPVKAEWLLEHDPYRARFVELAIAGGSTAGAKRLEDLREVDAVLAQVTEVAKKTKDVSVADLDAKIAPVLKPLKRASPAVRELAARRIINRADQYPNGAVVLAFELLRVTKAADRIELLTKAALGMTTYDPVKAAAGRARRGDAEAIAFLKALLISDERNVNEYHAMYAKEFAVEGLGALLLERPFLDVWLKLIEAPGRHRMTSVLFSKALNRYEKKSLLKTLTPAQTEQIVLALIAAPVSKPDKARQVVEYLATPSLHAKLQKALRGNQKLAKRYAEMQPTE